VHDHATEVTWTEVGGPKAALPATTGFGSRLVAATVEQLEGRIDYHWGDSGLQIELELPRRNFG